jgi:hypothetical protein
MWFHAHFEDNQFELNRADGRKLLKWNAVPTIFSVITEQPLLCLKKPVTATDESVERSMDHVYSKRPRIEEENLHRRPHDHSAVSSTSFQQPSMLSHSADFITTVMSNSSNIHCLEEVQNLPIAESRATEAVGSVCTLKLACWTATFSTHVISITRVILRGNQTRLTVNTRLQWQQLMSNIDRLCFKTEGSPSKY